MEKRGDDKKSGLNRVIAIFEKYIIKNKIGHHDTAILTNAVSQHGENAVIEALRRCYLQVRSGKEIRSEYVLKVAEQINKGKGSAQSGGGRLLRSGDFKTREAEKASAFMEDLRGRKSRERMVRGLIAGTFIDYMGTHHAQLLRTVNNWVGFGGPAPEEDLSQFNEIYDSGIWDKQEKGGAIEDHFI